MVGARYLHFLAWLLFRQVSQYPTEQLFGNAQSAQRLVGLGMMADRYQVQTVQNVVEDTLLSQLSLES
jgi:hypothetical protein